MEDYSSIDNDKHEQEVMRDIRADIDKLYQLKDDARDYINNYKQKIVKSPLESQGYRLAKLILEITK